MWRNKRHPRYVQFSDPHACSSAAMWALNTWKAKSLCFPKLLCKTLPYQSSQGQLSTHIVTFLPLFPLRIANESWLIAECVQMQWVMRHWWWVGINWKGSCSECTVSALFCRFLPSIFRSFYWELYSRPSWKVSRGTRGFQQRTKFIKFGDWVISWRCYPEIWNDR